MRTFAVNDVTEPSSAAAFTVTVPRGFSAAPARQPMGAGRLTGQELQRQHAHIHQVAAVDALEAFGDDCLDAQQQRPLGRPVA